MMSSGWTSVAAAITTPSTPARRSASGLAAGSAPTRLDSRLDQCGHCVVDDERLDLGKSAEGGGVERADSAEADQTQTHGEPFSEV